MPSWVLKHRDHQGFYASKGNNLLSMRKGQSEVVNSASAQMNVLAALLVSHWWEAAGGGWQWGLCQTDWKKGKIGPGVETEKSQPDKGTSLLRLLVGLLLHWKSSCLQQEELRAVLTLAACVLFLGSSIRERRARTGVLQTSDHTWFSPVPYTQKSKYFSIMTWQRNTAYSKETIESGWACEHSYLSPVGSLCVLSILFPHAIGFPVLKQCIVICVYYLYIYILIYVYIHIYLFIHTHK